MKKTTLNILTIVFCILSGLPTILYAQYHTLVIQGGATFSGNGIITVKDSLRNNNPSSPTILSGKVILSGTTQHIITNAGNGNIRFESFSVRGSGTKTIIGTLAVTDSLNIISNTSFDISNDTLRLEKNFSNAGTLLTNANSVVEFIRADGSIQSVPGGTFSGKVRFAGNSRKNISESLTVDSLEQSGWGLVSNNNISIGGKSTIDSLIDITPGATISFGSGNSTVATLLGNAGIIEVSPSGILTFANNATNGTGTIRTTNGEIDFLGNITSSGTLAINGSGIMSFGGSVASTNYSFTNTSTAIYNGSGQSIALANYGNLTINNSGTKRFLSGSTGIGGTILIQNDAVADAITNSSTINYNGTGAQTIGVMDYNNLTISDHGSQQITLPGSSTIRVAGTFMNSTNIANIINAGNTFEYNGSLAQTILAFPYYNLILSGSGEKTINASQTTNGDVLQQPGTSVVVDSGVIWQIDGSLSAQTNFMNNGDVAMGN